MIATIESIKSAPLFMELDILPEEIERLSDRVYRSAGTAAIPVYGYKNCSTRHGCSGATNCDYAYGDYHR